MTALNTDTEVSLAVRPQPLGAFPLPMGYLLIPAGDHTEEVRSALLAGRAPAQWPPALLAHAYALAGDRDSALAELTGSDPVTRYNRFVLDPDGDDADDLRHVLGEFGVLVDVVLFVVGRMIGQPFCRAWCSRIASGLTTTGLPTSSRSGMSLRLSE